MTTLPAGGSSAASLRAAALTSSITDPTASGRPPAPRRHSPQSCPRGALPPPSPPKNRPGRSACRPRPHPPPAAIYHGALMPLGSPRLTCRVVGNGRGAVARGAARGAALVEGEGTAVCAWHRQAQQGGQASAARGRAAPPKPMGARLQLCPSKKQPLSANMMEGAGWKASARGPAGSAYSLEASCRRLWKARPSAFGRAGEPLAVASPSFRAVHGLGAAWAHRKRCGTRQAR